MKTEALHYRKGHKTACGMMIDRGHGPGKMRPVNSDAKYLVQLADDERAAVRSLVCGSCIRTARKDAKDKTP
jgi:hypothetical protein